MAVVGVRVVANEIEAELACSVLRDDGIKCFAKPTDLAAGRADGLTTAGPYEIWVDESDAARARALLPR